MIWTHAAAAAAALAIGLASGWQARGWKADADELQRVELAAQDAARRAERATGAAQTFETRRESTRQAVRIITQEVERVVDRPVYLATCLDADGLRLAAAAAAGSASPAASAGSAVPAASAAD